VRRAFPGILSDLGKMVSAGAAMELVRELVPAAEPDERVFDTVTTLLTLLNEADGSHEEHLLVFELRMLAVAGFGPELDRCGGCGRVAHEGQAAQLDAERGSIVCRACGGGALVLSGASRAVMARASRSEWHVTSAPWAPKTLAQVRAATRSLLQHRLGRPLAGGALVAQIRELPGG
jgi:DNA repair protein RecO